MKLLLLGSWAAIFWGVSSMAGSEGNSVSNAVILASLHTDGKHGHHTLHASAGPLAVAGSRVQAVARELLLLLPRGLRRRLLPQHTRQWLGRSSSNAAVGVWRALLGGGNNKPGNANGGSSMDGQQQQQQQGVQQQQQLGPAAGASLPLSSSSPDFAAVLAPVGGARRG
jgi:hypothetical protein